MWIEFLLGLFCEFIADVELIATSGTFPIHVSHVWSAQGLLALVHRWGYGWDGVHWGRVQHEWFGLWVPAVPRCYCWRGGWIRRGGRRIWRMNQDMKKVSLGNLGSSALPASTLQTTEQQKKVQEKLIVCRVIHHKPPGIPWQFAF